MKKADLIVAYNKGIRVAIERIDDLSKCRQDLCTDAEREYAEKIKADLRSLLLPEGD